MLQEETPQFKLLARIKYKLDKIIEIDAMEYREIRSSYTLGFQEMYRQLVNFITEDKEIAEIFKNGT